MYGFNCEKNIMLPALHDFKFNTIETNKELLRDR